MKGAISEPHREAAHFLGRLGPAVIPRIMSRGGRPAHAPRVFEPSWAESLPLPLGEERAAGQSVALAGREGFERAPRADGLARAYAERPRTRVYESLGVRSDGWFSLVALHLAGLLRRHVVCTAYESRNGESNLGIHRDQWLGLIVQLRGAKQWRLWTADDVPPDTFVMQAGDVLVLPEHVAHDVSTPAHPGHSVHLVFAVTGQSIETWPGQHSRHPGQPLTGTGRHETQ